MKRLLGALAALLLATQAWADIVYVPEDPPGVDPSGYTVGADTVILGTNSYSAVLTPTTAGTEVRPKVWIGEGAGVVFAGVVPKSHNRFYNITFLGNVDFPANGKHVMFDRCTIVGSLNFKDADSSSVRNCTIRGTNFTVGRGITGAGLADADTLDGCTFTGLNASGGFGMAFGDNAEPDRGSPSDSCRYFVQRFNTFNISQSGPSAWTPSKHFQSPNFTSYHNKYTITNTATGVGNNEGDFGVLFRDNCYNGVMRGDTILLNDEGASFSSYGLMWSPGLAASNSSNQNFIVDSCYIRVFRGTAIFIKTQMPGMRIVNTVARSRLGTALGVFSGYEGTAAEPYIHHNTFMGDVAAHLGYYQRTTGGFSNNILYGTSTATCGQYAGAVVNQGGGLTSFSDSNFVYSTTRDSTKSFYNSSACMAPRAGSWAALGNDTHTYWVARPQFGDTAWATLDARPLLTFELWYQDLIGKYTLGYAGAHNEGYYDFNSQAVMQDPREYELPWSYPIRREDD